MFGSESFSYEDRLSELSELDDSFVQGDNVSCSTPIKLKHRRSYSLIDISNVNDELHLKKKLAVSTDTIGSGSQNSLCKDSGYVHSESNTSLNSNKDHKRFSELIQDLKFKEVLISELQESNHSLRLKYAEAENRIAELRLKCESHCDCCNYYSSSSNLPSTPLTDYGIHSSHRKASDHCSADRHPHPPTLDLRSKNHSDLNIPISNDESYLKVKRWQDSISTIHSDITTVQSKLSISDNTPNVKTRKIGERSVRISPISKSVSQLPTRTAIKTLENSRSSIVSTERFNKDVTLTMKNLQNLIIGDAELPVFMNDSGNLLKCSPSLCNSDYSDVIRTNNNINDDRKPYITEHDRVTLEGTTRASVSYQHEYNGKIGRVRYIDRKLEMERTIREGMNGIAEKAKKESGMRFKPWETNITVNHDKTEFFEFML